MANNAPFDDTSGAWKGRSIEVHIGCSEETPENIEIVKFSNWQIDKDFGR
jgi:hypothetical protein